MAEFASARRHYLRKRFDAKDRREYALESLWQSKQQAEAGADLPDDFPSRAALEAVGYTTEEDLDGADATELTTYVGLSTRQAEAVIAALAAL